ncbi:hypothetical protein JCM18899A_55370 [Nocardioides sp. AN3]
MSERYALMAAEKAHHKIEFMAGLLGVSRSGYYAWINRGGTDPSPGPRARHRAAVEEVVVASHEGSDGVNGHRRIRAELAGQGIHASVYMVRSAMRRLGIFGIQPRSKKRTTIPAKDAASRPDLLKRDFTAPAPGSKLVGDITYLRTGEGWLYLATVIDLYSRMVVGWSMADHMRTELISDALRMAHTHGHLADGAIFHSDRGSQYTSAEYAAVAAELGVTLSVGRTGSCHDNAVAESWFSMLKNEMYHRYRFPTRTRARFAVMDYIEVFYNRRRLHSTLGYRTPAAVHAAAQTQAATAA